MALNDSFVKKEFSLDRELEKQRKSALLEEMGITTDEVDKLQRTLLSPDEAIAAKNEELRDIRQHKGRRDYWWEFMDAKRRLGRVLHHSEFFRRLKTIVPNLVIADGRQLNRVGLYVVKNVPTDEVQGYKGTLKRLDCPIYACFSELGYIPEYEIDVTNDVQVAIGQKRGWRTILLNLIARKDQQKRVTSIITEDQALAAFGQPTNGDTSSFYRKRLFEFRNGDGSVTLPRV